MSFSALIPFVFMFICFVGFRFPLTNASFVALLTSTVITQTLFQATSEMWSRALNRTFQISVEIGLILLGAFFFLEVCRRTKTIESLAKLVREVSSNRVVQGVLVTFPMELMVEGSSGFGTPLLIIAPVLMALEFDIVLCALLPFVTFIVGIPYGALGTPIRLGFPDGSNVAHGVMCLLLIFTFISPLFASYLIQKKFRIKEVLWIFLLSSIYATTAFFISKTGPEFVALAPAFLTFVVGMVSARFLFRDEKPAPIREARGMVIYGLLLLVMWIGKHTFMDQLIPGTPIRIFNPGFVFILFGFGMLWFFRSKETGEILRTTGERSKRTLMVFFCMTFVVQQLRECGALTKLNEGLPDILLGPGAPVLGWLGSVFVGTSTVSNLLFSKVVDPVHFIALGAGSAIGVQMAFQSVSGIRSVIQDQLSEKEIFLKLVPLSIACITIVTVIYCVVLAVKPA